LQSISSPLFPRYGINDVVEGATDKELYVTRQKFNADFVFFKKERHLILPASMYNKKCAPSAIGGKNYE
jgi:phage portal protein BeeE